MVIPRSSSWIGAVFAVGGTALERIWVRLSITTGVAVAVTLADLRYGLFHTDLTTTPFTLIGLALSIFLGFRNNTSYDRFWEGRKLWGAMINVSRNIGRQISTLIDIDEATEKELVYRVIAYVHLVRLHLRDDPDHSELEGLVPAEEYEALFREWNRPVYLLQRLGERFRELYDQGRIHAMHLPVLEASLTEMTNIQGSCERIKSTPIPFAYNVLIHRIVAVYCFTLPFGLIQTVGMYTPIVVLLIAYAFFGLDTVGDQIEDPFGVDPNDLPLGSLCIIVERNLRQRLGEDKLPPVPTGRILT